MLKAPESHRTGGVIIDAESGESQYRLGEFSPARALLAPLIEGRAVMLQVASKTLASTVQPILFLTPLTVFPQGSIRAMPDEEKRFANQEEKRFMLVAGMPGGKLKLIDVRCIRRNDLHACGLPMRAARLLQAELEDLFGIDTDD